MTNDLEDRLGPALHARADVLVAPDDFAVRMTGHAHVVRRRRRVTGTVATVAVVGAVAFSMWPGRTALDGQPIGPPSENWVTPTPDRTTLGPGITTPPDEAVADTAALATWLAALPGGDPVRLPYTTATELVDGATRVLLPVELVGAEQRVHVDILGRTSARGNAGWVVKAVTPSGDGSEASQIGYLGDDGSYVELFASMTATTAAMSPDGTLVASSTSPFVPGPVEVRDVASGAVVAQLNTPAGLERIAGWAASGLLLDDVENGTVRLAQPDGASTELDAVWSDVVDPAGDVGLLVDADDCVSVVRLADPTVAIHEYCDGFGMVSPDGRWRVGRDVSDGPYDPGHVFDLETAAESALPLPDAGSWISIRAWESADVALLGVPAGGDDERLAEYAVVRCGIVTLTCEIALPPMPYDGDLPPYSIMWTG